VPLLPILTKHCPSEAVAYCYELWRTYPFYFKLSKARKGKYGDYRYSPKGKKIHQISVNENLNPYSFLLTYIHEVAHLLTFQQTHKKISPHGKEWKKNFQQLMSPLLSENIFPSSILEPLSQYMANPKATSCSDAALMKALHVQDLSASQKFLVELTPGETFIFHNRVFEKGATKRTRILCKELNTGKQYLISGQAMVEGR
jgi:SprT protein